MNIKIYKVLGEGFVIGEELDRTKENILVRYPGVLKMFPTKEPDQVVFKIIDLVPEFFEDFEELIQKFPLKRRLVYMQARPNKIVRGWYDQYLKDLTKKLSKSNIEVVGADVLRSLPKHPDGSFKPQ